MNLFARFAVAWYPIYRISVGPLKSTFLTYHSFHHIAHSNTLQSLLGQSTSHFDGNLTFPVIGLESYNTQVCALQFFRNTLAIHY